MLVQELVEFAETNLRSALRDIAWESKPVSWFLEVSSEGRFLGVTSCGHQERGGKITKATPFYGRVARSPVNRNNGHHPLIGADKIGYVLGPGGWTSGPSEYERQKKHHAAFVDLLRRAAQKTDDATLRACIRFYDDPREVENARNALDGVDAGSIISLSVDGPIVERKAVQAFWESHYEAAFGERVGAATGECLVSGDVGPISPTHERVKGTANLGTQVSGAALVSFDNEAFCSYGWEQNRNSPISPRPAMAYVLALNYLLNPNNRYRHDIAGIGFISWLSRKAEFDWYTWLNASDPKQVSSMSKFQARAEPGRNRFYMAGLSGNGGRLRVRYWVTDSLSHVKANLRDWHEGLRVHWPWGSNPPAVRLWQIQQATTGHGGTPGYCTLAIIRRAIEGPAQPLGLTILASALDGLRRAPVPNMGRLRVAAGLIRICLNDLLRQRDEKGDMTEVSEGLDLACRAPAYVCGRLMAEYEGLQRESSGGGSASVVDRYFSIASTFPAAAFSRIAAVAVQHLRKLRYESAAAAHAIDKRLTDLHQLLNPERPFPAKLSLEEQGLFVLGYYHQKAQSIARALSRKQDRRSAVE